MQIHAAEQITAYIFNRTAFKQMADQSQCYWVKLHTNNMQTGVYMLAVPTWKQTNDRTISLLCLTTFKPRTHTIPNSQVKTLRRHTTTDN